MINVQLFNGKCGHKVPSGSVEDRIIWLHVTATDSEGKTWHLPVDPKGFEGEEYTIAADVLAYQDMGIAKDLPDFRRRAARRRARSATASSACPTSIPRAA